MIINSPNVAQRKYSKVSRFLHGFLKGHSQLMHMRIRYHFLADMCVTRHGRETEREKRMRNISVKQTLYS